MKVFKFAVLVAFLFAASAKAGLDQLAAALPTCAVGSMTLWGCISGSRAN
jgi:hypothetical protein